MAFSGINRVSSDAVAFSDEKILELPWVRRVELRLVISAEGVGVMLQWSPIRRHGDEGAQVGFTDAQYILVGQIVGHAQAPPWILDHPHAGGDHRDGYLHRSRVLVRH